MNNLTQSRLATSLILLTGVWVAISATWISMSSEAQLNTFIVGAIVIIFSILQYFFRNITPSWINGIAAIWLFVSVFVYGMGAGASWSAVLAALVIVVLSFWDGIELGQTVRHHLAPTSRKLT